MLELGKYVAVASRRTRPSTIKVACDVAGAGAGAEEAFVGGQAEQAAEGVTGVEAVGGARAGVCVRPTSQPVLAAQLLSGV